MDGLQGAEHSGELVKRDLIGAIGERLAGIKMRFHEDTIASGRHCGPRQHGSEDAIASTGASQATGTLHGMRRIEHDAVSCLPNPIQ